MVTYPRLSEEQWHVIDLLDQGVPTNSDAWCCSADGKAWSKTEREGNQGVSAQGRLKTLLALQAKGLVVYHTCFTINDEGKAAIVEHRLRVAARKERRTVRVAVAQRRAK